MPEFVHGPAKIIFRPIISRCSIPGSTETFQFTFEDNQLIMEIVAPTGGRIGPPGMTQQQSRNLNFTGTQKTD